MFVSRMQREIVLHDERGQAHVGCRRSLFAKLAEDEHAGVRLQYDYQS